MKKINLENKEVFWDFDGTLFNSYPAMIQAVQSVLQPYHLSLTDSDLYARMMTTMSKALQQIITEYSLPLTMEDFDAALSAVDPASFLLYPGVKDVLAYISAHQGHNYLLTHRGHTAIEAIEINGLSSYFSEYITRDSSCPRKPDPASILDVIAHRHLEKDNVVVIGDRQLEIELARNAGVKCIWYASNPIVPSISPDLTIHDFSELLPSDSI